jgi:peptide/nickel transport system permease protein
MMGDSGHRATGAATPTAGPARGSRRSVARAFRSGSLLAGSLIVAALLAVALAAPWLAPHAPTAIFPGAEIEPPGPRFPLGTDEVGRDILSRLLYGARVSLGVAIPSVGLAGIAGTAVGVALGYRGGASDLLAMRLFDVLFAFPPILLAIALVAALGPSTLNLILTIGVLTLPQFAVLARSATLALKPQEFVQAARALGASHGRILRAHVLPNLAGPLAVQASLSLSIVILVEAALSFLGLGTQPPAPSWGGMLSRGRQYMTIAPWLVLAPGVAIMLAVLGFNLLGDAQRDLLDPRRSGARGRKP